MTSERDRQELLRIAREALAAHLTGGSLDIVAEGELARPAGVFVTLTQDGVLRGCIGHLEPTIPVAHVVARCAAAAGTADPRFAPVTAAELSELEIEVTILGCLEVVTAIEAIEVGRHGLVVAAGRQKGVLLPKVAVEQGWDPQTFVDQTCRKAGLPPEGWQCGTLWRFEAEVFAETDESTRRLTSSRRRSSAI
jgi:AmmeMemoRadiSam system protein A